MTLTLALLLLAAYLGGSVPTGVWLTRRRGVDPRDIGSGNIGATNVARAAGPAFGLLTLAGDAVKGLLPVLIAAWLGIGPSGRAAVGLAAFVGHLFPIFLGFQGGKGVATSFGVILGLAPLGIGLALPVFLLTVGLSGYVSLGSLLAAAVTPMALIVLGYPLPTDLAAGLMGLGIAIRHRDNIRRMRFGTESQLGSRSSSPDSDYA